MPYICKRRQSFNALLDIQNRFYVRLLIICVHLKFLYINDCTAHTGVFKTLEYLFFFMITRLILRIVRQSALCIFKFLTSFKTNLICCNLLLRSLRAHIHKHLTDTPSYKRLTSFTSIFRQLRHNILIPSSFQRRNISFKYFSIHN